MIEAVVFDMDGLLVDSEPLWQRARVGAFGADRLRWTEADQQAVMGSSTQAWADLLAARLDYAFSTDDIIERVVTELAGYYRASVPLLPGAREIIATLRGRFPLGIATGLSYRLIEAVLEGAGWTDAFAEVLSADDVAHGKPAPDIYVSIAERMGVPAGRTVVFEDSVNGILAGIAAGMQVFAVPSYYQRPPADVLQRAVRVLESLADFRVEMLAGL